MILHSQQFGEGTPFIILHGFLGMSDNWKTLGRQFAAQGYAMHLVDQRNHGRSFHDDEFSYDVMATDLYSYCEHHGIDKMILLGHSMGGKTAMNFAVRYPEKVEKLIIADIGPKGYPQHHQDILKSLSLLDFSEIVSRKQADEVLAQYIPDMGTRLFLLKNLYRVTKDQLGLRVNLPVLTETISEIGKALNEKDRFDGKTLFLRGANSGYIEDLDMLGISHHFPKANLETVPKAGHWLHAENPKDFYELVMNFLAV